MTRFYEIIQNLRNARLETLEQAKKRRASSSTKASKPLKKIEFESPELNAIFTTMPKEIQDIMKKAAKKK